MIDVLCRTKLLLDGVDNFILSQRSLINKRKRALLPIVRERTALAESYVRHLQMLGLEKRQPPAMDLQAYLRQRTAEKAESKLPTGKHVRAASNTTRKAGGSAAHTLGRQ